ncbi:MAG TPA: methyltransferase domain-containing protein [Streptosporangiaceae bacterium]
MAPVNEPAMEPPAVTILPRQEKVAAAAAPQTPAAARQATPATRPATPAATPPTPPTVTPPTTPAITPPTTPAATPPARSAAAPPAPATARPAPVAAPSAPKTRSPAPAPAAALPAQTAAPPAPAGEAHSHRPGGGQADDDLFGRYAHSLVAERSGHPVTILQAGCTTASTDLGVAALRAAGAEIVVTLIDDDQPVTRAAVGQDQSMADCLLGDLRTVPLPQRSHDIVLCTLLLQRIKHTELVLDRLVGTLRPGGLLLLRFTDRDSAAGFLDRVLPAAARRMAWRRRHPGQPGPYPAVYERLSSAKGLQSYVLMREVVIAERRTLGGRGGTLATPAIFQAAQALVARLSGGRLTDGHEELLYVLRKPEDRFARVL